MKHNGFIFTGLFVYPVRHSGLQVFILFYSKFNHSLFEWLTFAARYQEHEPSCYSALKKNH
jgi:hypothetical protein